MTNSLETSCRQKQAASLRLDHKLVTSLQILQMPVKDLEQFLEEKLVLNPLVPLELLKSKELLMGDLGSSWDTADPFAETLFWQSVLQKESEKSQIFAGESSHEAGEFSRSSSAKEFSPPLKIHGENEIDLIIYFQGSSWKIASPQPYQPLVEKCLLELKNLPEITPLHTPFWKELLNLQYALDARKNLLISIGKELTSSWNTLFQNGAPVPLDLSETAKRLGRHRTTLFRAIKGKTLFTPEGIISLETLFEGKRAQKKRQSQKK
jgi:DNA-directed RNA polymerase specialized sigma54-like protein